MEKHAAQGQDLKKHVGDKNVQKLQDHQMVKHPGHATSNTAAKLTTSMSQPESRQPQATSTSASRWMSTPTPDLQQHLKAEVKPMSPRLRLGEGWQVSLDNLIRITDVLSVEPQIDDHMSELNVEGHGEEDDNSIDREKIKDVVNLVVKKPEVSEGHRDQEELLKSSEHADEETANFHKVQLPKVDKEKRRKKEMSSKPEVSELSELEVLGKPVKTISEIPDLKVDEEKEEEEEDVFKT